MTHTNTTTDTPTRTAAMAACLLAASSAALGQFHQTGPDAAGDIPTARTHRAGLETHTPAATVVPELVATEAPPPPVDPRISLEGMAGSMVVPDLPEGYIVIQGDIQLSPAEQAAWKLGGPEAVFGSVTYWPVVVPYDFTASVNASQQTAAINAMNAIGQRAGVVFRPAIASDANRIRFNASTFNNAAVGMQGGTQIVNIVSWNTQIIIVHELYHALGFWHEQSASDRNTFVTINYGNVCGSSTVPGNGCNASVCNQCINTAGTPISCAFNFDIVPGASIWGYYDFDSFMHYGRTAFSCNGQDTITVNAAWNSQWQNAIGQRDHFSLIDTLSCRGLYPFLGDRWLRQGAGGTGAGSFTQPFNGTFVQASGFTPQGGTLFVDPGTYAGVGLYTVPKTYRATFGTATIGN